MIIYHGSIEIVENPEIRVSDAFLDFGTGFYTTSSFEQAQRWALTKMRRMNKDVGYVSVYDFDYEAFKRTCTVNHFESADMNWLNFVIGNRQGNQSNMSVDMNIGPVADDNVYRSIRLFETGVLDAEETVKRLKTELLHDQWVFHSKNALAFLKFVEYKEVSKENQL